MSVRKAVIHLTLALCSENILADAIQIECPKNIEVIESAQNVGDEWKVEKDLGKRGKFLDSVSVYSGHPNNMGNLIPDKTSQTNRQRKYLWIFNENDQGEFWVACTYTNSALLLTKPIRKGTRRCELTEKLLPTGAKLAIESMNCE